MNTSIKELHFSNQDGDIVLIISINTDSYNNISRIADAVVKIEQKGLLLTGDCMLDYWNLRQFKEDLDKLYRRELLSVRFDVSFEQSFVIEMFLGESGRIENHITYEPFDRNYQIALRYYSDLSFIQSIADQVDSILAFLPTT